MPDNTYRRLPLDIFLHCTLGGFAPASASEAKRRAWTEDEDRRLAALWPELRTKAIAKRLNRSPEAVRIRARLIFERT